MSSKSPFILLENVIDTEACNDIIASLKHYEPNYMEGKPVMTAKFNKLEELRLTSFLDDLLDYAETYYGFETQSVSDFIFEWYPEGCETTKIGIDGWTYFNGEWRKKREIDFTVLFFLSSEQSKQITDVDSEHAGGGLQFPTHNFTLHPNAGDVLMFPANNHFLNAVTGIKLGNMNMIRTLITAKDDYKYDRRQYPGTHKLWFS